MRPRCRTLAAVAASFLLPASAPWASARPADVGQPLPGFEATALSGQALSLEAAIRDHKAVVVLFTSTVCPYANYFEAHVRELSEAYGPRGVLFVGVNINNWESRQEVLDHTRGRGFSFPMITWNRQRE